MNEDPQGTEDSKERTAREKTVAGTAHIQLPKLGIAQTIKGVVVTGRTPIGVPGLQVFLHEDEAGDSPRIGAAITDENGYFSIRHSVTVRSIEFSTRDATRSIVRKIAQSGQDRLSFSLTAEELKGLLPTRDAKLEEREGQWRRQMLIRRELVRARGLEVIERLNRRRDFGARIAEQLDLSTVPTQVREKDPSFVEPDTPVEELSDRLLELGRQAVAQVVPKQHAIRLDTERLAGLKKQATDRGTLLLEDVLGIMDRRVELPPTEEERQILEKLRDEISRDGQSETPMAAEAADDSEAAGAVEGDEQGPEPDELPESADQYVRHALAGLYQNGRRDGLPLTDRGDQEAVAADISGISMGGGPADVTSYHEFRTVRIAFDPLWTEYFDPQIANLVETVLGGLERFEDDLPFEEVTALEALEPFLDIAEELGADLEQPAEFLEPPPNVKTLLPDMYPGTWTALSPGLRETLEKLGEDYEEVKELIFQQTHPLLGGPTGVYFRKNDTDYTVLSPQKDDFWFMAPHPRMTFSDKRWIDPDLVTVPGVDIDPSNPTHKPIYHLQGDNSWSKFVRRTAATAIEYEGHVYVEVNRALDTAKAQLSQAAREAAKTELDLLKQMMQAKPDAPADGRAQNNLETLARLLSGKEADAYRFKTFAAGSVNFGILLKYRQAWEPQNYQVGDLVRTIPLAPKESRKFKKHLVVKKSRSQKEIEGALQTKSDAEEHTGRAESEIVRRAQNATNFEATASGKGGIGIVEFGGSATAKASAQDENSKNKKKMRQAVQKAAHEYKQERRVEITTVSSEELDTTESGEISNPNEEITVTYLFYELQKQFLVNERLVDIEPIVLIALDVPMPSEITESWLIRHDWILKRVLLDDSFLPAFKLLEESNEGRDVLIGILRDDLRRKVDAFEEIKEQVATNLRVKNQATAALKKAVDQRIEAINAQQSTAEEAGDVALTIFTGGLFGSQGLLGVGGTAGEGEGFEKPEAAEARQEAVEEMLARTGEEARRLRSLLEGAEVALDRAIHKYAEAVRARFNKELAVLRLRNHIAQNILYYMQAIWEYEPPDQRFFRTYDIRVPDIGGQVGVDVGDDEVTLTYSSDGINMSDPQFKRLADVADLDTLLGFKGNFMIFPLRQHNYLTAWMVQDYLDADGQVRDPDADQMPNLQQRLQAVTTEVQTLQMMAVELDNQMEQLQTMPDWEDVHPAYEAARRRLQRQIQLEQSKIEPVVVPTDLLFIEALPGKHPLLEDFKLLHRALDVEKVVAERDALELENIRRTARLLDGNYDDPEVDKSISVAGAQPTLTTDI